MKTNAACQPNQKKRPRPLRQRLQHHRRAAYRDAILKTAEENILRRGFHAVKMTDIAESMGVAVGTLYNYFDSKEAVVLAITENHHDRFQTHMGRSFSSDEPLMQLRELVARAAEFVEQNGALFDLYMQWKADEGPASELRCRSLHDKTHERFASQITEMLDRAAHAERIRTDIPVAQLVWMLLAMLEVSLLDWWSQPETFSCASRGKEIVAVFLDGVVPR